jgi:hypothetical protein
MPISSQRGMHNPNVLCYRNSLFQALLHQPKLVNWLLQSHRPQDCVSDREEECLPCCLRLVTLGYWQEPQLSVELSTLLTGMSDLFASCNSSFFLPNIKIAVTDLSKWGGHQMPEMDRPTQKSNWLGCLVQCAL